jgi:pimeloyl-ACP methyl ester carboxylesterase
LVDVGGYDLHLYCTGEGGPTVVMDAGLGDWSLHFRALQERVAEFTRVCTFDHAGYGWSESSPLTHDSKGALGQVPS